MAHVATVAHSPFAWVVRAGIGICLFAQLRRIRPFTPFASVQVQQTRQSAPEASLRLLFANVLQTNRNARGLVDCIRSMAPDVVLALETDAWWADQLAVLSEDFPYRVLQPQDNTYGMVLYSRRPLIAPTLSFLIEDGVPSIHARVRLANGAEVQLHCLHPRPPSPTEANTSKPRDAELLVVGREIKENPCPVVVMGDMNDVAWSHTSDLFRHVSGLLDPRVGRGFFNTFNAKHWLVRFPLDHFFHSNDFRLIEFKRLPAFGSDHFPVLIHLSHEPHAMAEQHEQHADASERREAQEKVATAGGGA